MHVGLAELRKRRNEIDLAIQERSEVCAPVGRGLEVLVGPRSEVEWIEKENGVVESGIISADSIADGGPQELVSGIQRKRLDLKRIRWVFVGRVARCCALQALMHCCMNDLVNDEAPVEVDLREL